jgi:predicted acylesterase/phospholipase RssA
VTGTGSDSERTQVLERLAAEADAIEAPCDPAHYRVLSRMVQNPGNHLAVGFGGGSIPGLAGNCAFAHILEELDLLEHVESVWGTSAGSIIGAGWAGGASALSMLEHLSTLDRRTAVDISRWELFVKGLWRYFRRGVLPEGFVRGQAFRRSISGMLPVARFEQTRFPLRVIACTDDGHARKVVFRSGSLLDAVMASMCIPGVMAPVAGLNGEEGGYFDGGVVEKTPLASIMEEHGRGSSTNQLLVLCTHYSALSRARKPLGFLQRFVSTISVLEERVWEAQRDQAFRAPDTKAIVLNPHFGFGSIFDFENTGFLYLAARQAYKAQLSNAGLSMRFGAR